MKVRELIAKLLEVDVESRVFMGYDGNVVVTEPSDVEQIANDGAVGNCWYSVHPGDVVILCDE